MTLENFEDLINGAAGTRSDYALEHVPLSDEGGQGQVFRATHKPTGTPVAFKRLRIDTDDAVARMRREIRIGRKLRDHPHVVPVLDSDRDHRWFVMPLAEGSLVDNRALVSASSKALRRLLEQLVSGLAAAHELGWVHRDIKPANVLLLEAGRWALGDWGLVRGPRGQTTLPNRTRVGQSYGTVGFGAPELSNDAHAATFAADIYSLGQIVGWALVGQEPHANVPLLPIAEPWRGVAKAATRFDATQRPQSCEAFLDLMAGELDEPPLLAANAGEALLAALRGGDSAALHRLWTLAARNRHDYDLYIDVLPQLANDEVTAAVRRDRATSLEIAEAMAEHLGGDWQHRDFSWANAVIRLPWRIARTAASDQDWDLLETALETVAQWDESWDQWDVQKAIRTWLSALKGDAARIAARIMQAHPDSARHFAELAEDRRVDQRLRAAVSP